MQAELSAQTVAEGVLETSPKSFFRVDTVDGQAVGYGWRQTTKLSSGRRMAETYNMRIRERGNLVKTMTDMFERLEDEAGNITRLQLTNKSGGTVSQTTANITNESIHVTRSVGRDVRSETIPRPANLRFDAGSGLIRSWDFTAKPELEFLNFNLGARAIERVVIKPHSDPQMPQGGMTLLRTSFSGSSVMSVSKLSLNAARDVLKTTRFQFGTMTETRPMPEGPADPGKFPAFSVLENSLVKSPFRILDPALKGQIRFVFRFREGIEFSVPETVNQRVTLRDGILTLNVCDTCGPKIPLTDEARADALRPTAWLQSDHPLLRDIAAPIKRLKIPDAQKMERLAIAARKVLARIDYSGHYSALEALKRGAGDCTEDAIVLAALGRAAGIPTKVASGFAYSRPKYHGMSNVFIPHNWTLAYADGRWQSFDMSLQAFDASHIAINIGDGDARSLSAASQLAGLLIWEKMTEIKRRPVTGG